MGSRESKDTFPQEEQSGAPPPKHSNRGKRIPKIDRTDTGPRHRGIVVVGSHGSGKSSIISKLQEHLHNGNDDYYHYAELSGDTKTMTTELRKAQVEADQLSENAKQAIVYVVDLTDPESLHLLSQYVHIAQCANGYRVRRAAVSWSVECIVASKIDLPEEQRVVKLMDFAEHLGRLHYTAVKKVSGETGQGIQDLAQQLRLHRVNRADLALLEDK